MDRRLTSLSCKVGMTHRPTLEKLASILGGEVHAASKSRTNIKPVWYWNVRSQGGVREVLGRIRPWLVTKAEEADVMLAYLGRVEKGKINRADRQAVYWRLRELKRG